MGNTQTQLKQIQKHQRIAISGQNKQNKLSEKVATQFPENCNFQQEIILKFQPKHFQSQFTASRMKMVDTLQKCNISLFKQTYSGIADTNHVSIEEIQLTQFAAQAIVDTARERQHKNFTTSIKKNKSGETFCNDYDHNPQSINTFSERVVKTRKFIPMVINNDMFIGYKKSDIMRDFIRHRNIGQGSFGEVFLATCRQTNQIRAIKALKKQKLDQKDLEENTMEISLLRQMDHPNIIRVFDIYLNKHKLYIVMENCEGGPLDNLKLQNKQENVKTVMYQLLSAVGYVHSKGYIHRDIKLDNILLYQANTINKDFFIKLIDFGLCEKYYRGRMNKQKVSGTLGYIAPEVLKGEYNELSDIWSCGVVMYNLLSGTEPFLVPRSKKITMNNIFKKSINFNGKRWDNVSRQAKSLIKKMLNREVNKRISVEQAMNHSWFTNIKKQRNSQVHDQILLKLDNLQERSNNLVSLIESYLIFKRVSSNQQTELANIFNCLDCDGNGVIDQRELVQAFKRYLPGEKNLERCQQIISRIDKNKSKKIDFSEFMVAMFDKSELYENQIIEEFFRQVDIQHRGFIKRNQLKAMLKGSDLQEVQYVFEQLDANKDNKITLDQFKAYLKKYFE